MYYGNLLLRVITLLLFLLACGLASAQTDRSVSDLSQPILKNPTPSLADIRRPNFHPPVKPTHKSSCDDALVADVVAIDHPIVFNRLGAQNINWMMYALRHDVIDIEKNKTFDYTDEGEKLFQKAIKRKGSGIALRPDLRPRPLVLRVAEGGHLKVRFTNLLSQSANPHKSPDPLKNIDHPMESAQIEPGNAVTNDIFHIDDQVASRSVGFHPQGLELEKSINSDSSYVGKNKNSLVAPGETKEYCFFAPHEGSYLVSSDGAIFGGEGTSGNSGVGLFGAVTVQPKGASFYRAQVTEEEMRLASKGETPSGQPNIDYEATYPNDCGSNGVWCKEGKAGKPILNMVQDNRIIHGDINALIIGTNEDGSFKKETYPLESKGKQNPALPNRLEPFREFVSIFHDENAAIQAFPYFFEHPELSHTLHGVRDSFMINYGSGGVGAEIIANRLKIGPMQDCLDCAYEEFFLSSFAVGDAAMLVDNPVNLVVGQCQPEYLAEPEKYKDEIEKYCTPNPDLIAKEAYYPHDPANVHHSYIGDFVKFRNLHSGKEQHIFHLHNHQWLFNPNDDNSNYIDAQGIGPGSGYTYEIAYGGSGNRNKTVGDAIFHCHFYPHFAQGMWYMWRIHDVFEEGTQLAVTPEGDKEFHKNPFDLMHGKPAAMSRALPDGEIIAGTPIPAIVPLPGKGMPPMPEAVHVQPKSNGMGSHAKLTNPSNVDPKNKNPKNPGPGYPFWIAGVTEHGKYQSSIGSRPTTPPLDMSEIPGVVKGHDGGLPRHALAGYSAGGTDEWELNRMTAEKHLVSAKPIYFDEKGTDLEKVAMNFHAIRNHATHQIDMHGNVTSADFVTNGAGPLPGAPYNDPCIDDHGEVLRTGKNAHFFGGKKNRYIDVTSVVPGGIEYGGDSPRVYKGANLQLDVVFNKQGYHYPQQRILTLWEDVGDLLDMKKPPEPLVMRLNTFDCAMYAHTNLVPHYFYADDYQITTPTDVIGQHIHLPKWDLTSADGGANGWNYEDGTFSPGIVRERIDAINKWNAANPGKEVPKPDGTPLVPTVHPYFNAKFVPGHQANNCLDSWNEVHGDSHKFDVNYGMPGKCDWFGARTTLQRWFSDPLVNAGNLKKKNSEVHRGLGITFTHDHLGPSTHQQLGLYATMLTEPPGSKWLHNESGNELYDKTVRDDGGPTSWQAIIVDKNDSGTIDVGGNTTIESHREFFLQFGDFQHAYQKGEYYGVSEAGIGWKLDPTEKAKPTSESFRYAINPSVRKPANPEFPDVVAYEPTCPGGEKGIAGAVYNKVTKPLRPCPEAISADDIGMMVVNYRNEPIAARVYDPDEEAWDGKKGRQTDNFAGDLAFAMQTRTDRKIPELNTATGNTPYKELTEGILEGDPFTPIMRAYSGDFVRIKVQGGAHEHEHNGSINGLAWIQGGSGFGQAPHSGWRNSQNTGLSEQFTFSSNLADYWSPTHLNDRMYTLDSSQDGMWNGIWGILRSKIGRFEGDKLELLPSNPKPKVMALTNRKGEHALNDEDGRDNVCPPGAPIRAYDVVAVLANNALSNSLGVTIPSDDGRSMLDPDGGTLVYNPRATTISIEYEDEQGHTHKITYGAGPLHDPTAIMFVRAEDLDKNGKIKHKKPVEPLVLRAAAGECIQVALHNHLPYKQKKMPDLDGYVALTGIQPRDQGLDSPGSKMTTFNNNLIRPSNQIGLHPQLVHYNVQSGDGNNIGINRISTVSPGKTKVYQWYAGITDINSCKSIDDHDPKAKDSYWALNYFLKQDENPQSLHSLNEAPHKEMFNHFVMSTLNQKEQKINDRIKSLVDDGDYVIEKISQNRDELTEIIDIAVKNVKDKLSSADYNCLRGENHIDLKTQYFDPISTSIKNQNCIKELSLKEPVIEEFQRIFNDEFGTLKSRLQKILTPQFTGEIKQNILREIEQQLPPKLPSSSKFRLMANVKGTLREKIGSDLTQQMIVGLKNNISRELQSEISPEQDQKLKRSLKKLLTPVTSVASNVAIVSDTFTFKLSRIVSSLIMPEEGITSGKPNPYEWLKNVGKLPELSEKTTQLVKCEHFPVEFGATNLSPPDRIKQGQKAAVGALIIEPEESTWKQTYKDKAIDRQNPGNNQQNKRQTRTTATVTYPVKGERNSKRHFRDLVMVHQKGLNLRYADGRPVENLDAEKEGAHLATAPEDAHDAGHMAINYGTEPLWFRFGLPPDAPFGKKGLGGVTNAWQAFSNKCCDNGGTAISAMDNVGEPYVPIMTVPAGSEMRIRALMPTGVGRASTMELHGHGWPRDPYLAERVVQTKIGSFPKGSHPGDPGHSFHLDGWGVPSKCIGDNAMAMYLGGQESVSPMAHYDLVFPRAGGTHSVKGDYLWRDHTGFGITSGLWGIVRVESRFPFWNKPAPLHLRRSC